MGNSFLLIVAGLLLFYLVVSDKWKCVEGFAGCVTGLGSGGSGNAPNTVSGTGVSFPAIPNTIIQPQNSPILALNTNWANQYGF